MSTINQYIAELSDLVNNIDEHINTVIVKNQGKIVGTIKLRLFNKGVDANLLSLGQYSEGTVTYKRNKGQPAGHITLRDTGDFYKGMFAVYENNKLIIDSTDSKTSELEYLFGEAILGLTEQEQNIIIDTMIEPELFRKIDGFGSLDLTF